jgi:single-strand DNA-binding protein
VYVEGRLSTRSWETNDGQRRFSVEINASEMVLLDSRPRGDSPEGHVVGEDADDLDAIPF